MSLENKFIRQRERTLQLSTCHSKHLVIIYDHHERLIALELEKLARRERERERACLSFDICLIEFAEVYFFFSIYLRKSIMYDLLFRELCD